MYYVSFFERILFFMGGMSISIWGVYGHGSHVRPNAFVSHDSALPTFYILVPSFFIRYTEEWARRIIFRGHMRHTYRKRFGNMARFSFLLILALEG